MPAAASTRDLARHLGKSHTAIAKWLRDDRWPFSRRPPWTESDVARIAAWAKATLAPDPAAMSTSAVPDTGAALSAERQVKVAIGLEKLESAKLANQARRGELHSVADCQQRLAKLFVEMRTALLNVADSLPLDSDAKDIVRGSLLSLCRRFAGEAAPQSSSADPSCKPPTPPPLMSPRS